MKQQDYLDIAAASDKASFQALLVGLAGRMEFGRINAALIVERSGGAAAVHAVGNVPEPFLKASKDVDDALRDPVLNHLKRATRPVLYDQQFYVNKGAADLWEQQAPYGYHAGISVGLHAAGGRHFLLGVDRDTALPDDEVILTRLMADVYLLAVFAQEAAVRLLEPNSGRPPAVKRLSPRERECLEWTREGKTTWVIGQILAISEHTVDFHIRNACKKLGATNKHVAIHRAASMGVL